MRLPTIFRILVPIIVMACGADSTGPGTRSPISDDSGVISSLSISGAQSGVEPGETAVLTATAVTAEGRPVNEGVVTWQSSNTAVATVASSGNRTATFTGVGSGVTQVSAQLSGITNSTSVTVSITLPGQNEGSTAAFIYTEQDGMEFIRLPSGATGIEAQAVNDLGQVVGRVLYSNTTHAFLWSRANGMTDLGAMPGGASTEATAISQNGQVAGSSSGADGVGHAFRWTLATGMVELESKSVGVYSYATGINSSGQVVGYRYAPAQPGPFGGTLQGQVLPFRWSEAQGFEILPTSGYGAQATAINDAGQVAGWLDDGDYGFAGAVLWTASGTRTDLAACIPTGCAGAAAFAISSNGMVAGISGTSAFTWTSESGSRVVPGVPWNYYSPARGINDKGTAVGGVSYSERIGTTYVYREYGFLWSAAGGYREILAPRGRTNLHVTGINNKDQIVGFVE